MERNYFIAPGKIYTGYNILEKLNLKLEKEKIYLILIDENVEKIINKYINNLEKDGFDFIKIYFGGECSFEEVNRISQIAEDKKINSIIGFGGGKILDTAKAVSKYTNIQIITIPTIAATCAGWSSHSAMYSNDGKSKEYLSIDKNPDIIFIDKKIIFESPVRYTVSGIVDTLAKWIEASATSSNLKSKTIQLETALDIAKKSYDYIFKYSEKVINDIKNKNYSEEVDKMIDVIIVSAGLVGGIGGAACRAAASHSINNGFTVFPKKYKENLHGEVVGFGNIVQLLLDNVEEKEINKYIKLLIFIKSPVTLKEMGYSIDNDYELDEIVNKCLEENESVWDLPYAVNKELIKEKIIEADKISSRLQK